MKLVISGGTGLIGSKLVTKLREQGHEAVAASPATGINTLTGEGLDEALQGASVEQPAIPFSIVHATQFFEFVKSIAAAATTGNTVRLAPVLVQPMVADDVAKAIARTAEGAPLNDTVEVAGPEQFRLDELVRQGLSAIRDPREVVTDPHARYFGAEMNAHSLVPGANARLGEIRFNEWLGQPALQA